VAGSSQISGLAHGQSDISVLRIHQLNNSSNANYLVLAEKGTFRRTPHSNRLWMAREQESFIRLGQQQKAADKDIVSSERAS
jgi:hypothetical protein